MHGACWMIPILAHFGSLCATFLHQKILNIRNIVDGPYMLLGNVHKTFTKTVTTSHDEESLVDGYKSYSNNLSVIANEKFWL